MKFITNKKNIVIRRVLQLKNVISKSQTPVSILTRVGILNDKHFENPLKTGEDNYSAVQ